jgi:hypothetical protein
MCFHEQEYVCCYLPIGCLTIWLSLHFTYANRWFPSYIHVMYLFHSQNYFISMFEVPWTDQNRPEWAISCQFWCFKAEKYCLVDFMSLIHYILFVTLINYFNKLLLQFILSLKYGKLTSHWVLVSFCQFLSVLPGSRYFKVEIKYILNS